MADRLRIGLLTHSVNPRGGVVHTVELAQALHALGHDVTVFAPAGPGQTLFRPLACHFEPVPVSGDTDGVAGMAAQRIDAFVRHLAPRVAENPFDLLHAQDGLGANALATLEERGLIAGFVRTVHHLDPYTDERLAAWQLRGVLRARAVLCVSDLWQRILRDEYGVAAGRVNNGVDLERWTARPDARDATLAARLGIPPGPLLLAVGGIEERKNTVRVLQAFAALRSALPQARLVIAGGASLLNHDRYRQTFDRALQASGLHAGEDVIVTGRVDDADMPSLFRLADALVMASTREGFGLVVLEALACGTPVVASRIAPFTEYLDDDSASWADPLDIASIAQAMEHALDPSRAALLRTPPAVCHRYGWAASAARHLELYRASGLLPARQPETV
ncbi:Glycosyl transferases group 1 protein [Methyloversatilis universalis FAM5]|uniref:Glycosyl transferases group 1 protein n=1 Tax=Methyloversatilis universalis (strain ATCC BAA-1314 / DSM 25237 / JCM 13912 / CCUG 52030 / FAM5) TaxID=1000565 RepID=F5RHY3_METUF|nr:MSMEG_0565 family glycosyltransferase [Methyloversatilis universalis]EGK69965.1 Glycosyl transferases group 1 protein [Methyloversatilis universalis FAM5]